MPNEAEEFEVLKSLWNEHISICDIHSLGLKIWSIDYVSRKTHPFFSDLFDLGSYYTVHKNWVPEFHFPEFQFFCVHFISHGPQNQQNWNPRNWNSVLTRGFFDFLRVKKKKKYFNKWVIMNITDTVITFITVNNK